MHEQTDERCTTKRTSDARADSIAEPSAPNICAIIHKHKHITPIPFRHMNKPVEQGRQRA